MIVFKSFWRKKTTHIYFIIILFIQIVFGLFICGKSYYIKLNNSNYENSYIYLTSKEDITSELKKIRGIKWIEKGFSYDEEVFIKNSKVAKNEIIIPDQYKQRYAVNSTLQVSINDNEYSFIVKGYVPNYNLFLVNKEVINKVLSNAQEFVYVMDLKDWSKSEKIFHKLSTTFSGDIREEVIKKNNIQYDDIMIWLNVFIFLNILLFMIILVLTIINILEDEKKNVLMYRCLGFTKLKIISINILKLLELFVLPFLLSFSIFFIIYITII